MAFYNSWIVWLLLIIIIAFIIVVWARKKGHIKDKLPPPGAAQPVQPASK